MQRFAEVQRLIENPRVGGSIPSPGTIISDILQLKQLFKFFNYFPIPLAIHLIGIANSEIGSKMRR